MPASLGNPEVEKALATLTEFPEVKGDMTAIMGCAVQAMHNGKLKGNMCFLQNDFDQPFAGALFKAAKKARLVPATIDGREKTVYLQYRAEFIKEGERQEIILYPNPGIAENVEAYGKDHVAAHRVIGKESWQKACPKRARYMVRVKAHVDEQGAVSNISLSHGGGIVPPASCQDAIIAGIAASEFIPAMADGIPVPSTFAEPFSN